MNFDSFVVFAAAPAGEAQATTTISLNLLFGVIGLWLIFKKAGRPGWAALIPIYNLYVLLQVVGRPGWWLLLLLVPVVNLVVLLLVAFDLAARFGRTSLFGLGLFCLTGLFLLILGAGKSTYSGLPVRV